MDNKKSDYYIAFKNLDIKDIEDLKNLTLCYQVSNNFETARQVAININTGETYNLTNLYHAKRILIKVLDDISDKLYNLNNLGKESLGDAFFKDLDYILTRKEKVYTESLNVVNELHYRIKNNITE